MGLPDKRIKKITLPGDVEGSRTYEVIPERLGKDGHSVGLPNLTADATLALTSDLQDISVSEIKKQWAKSTSMTSVSTATE